MSYKISEKSQLCLECGDAISYGRTDRKFCCDSCKNKYNNRRARNSRNMKQRVRNALERNYDILVQLLKLEVHSMDLSDLVGIGFNLDFVTAYRKVRGHDEFRCFDIRYFRTASRIFSIEKVPAFADSWADKERLSLQGETTSRRGRSTIPKVSINNDPQ